MSDQIVKVMSDDYNEGAMNWSLHAIKKSLPELKESLIKYLDATPSLKDRSYFNVAEFGVATGGCSVVPLEVIIDTVRERYPEMQISVFLNDLPDNRFDIALKFITEGLQSYKNVFFYPAPSDFTIPVFPDNYLDFSFCNFSLQILPFVPGPLVENCLFCGDRATVEQEWANVWVEAYRNHLEKFFSVRLRELQPNGIFFAITLSAAEDPKIQEVQAQQKLMYLDISIALKEQLKELGILDKFQSIVKTTCYVETHHFREIIAKLPTEVILLEEKYIDDIFTILYDTDADKIARGQACFVKAWWLEVIRGNLKQEGLLNEKTEEVIKEFFAEKIVSIVKSHIERGIYPPGNENIVLAFKKI